MYDTRPNYPSVSISTELREGVTPLCLRMTIPHGVWYQPTVSSILSPYKFLVSSCVPSLIRVTFTPLYNSLPTSPEMRSPVVGEVPGETLRPYTVVSSVVRGWVPVVDATASVRPSVVTTLGTTGLLSVVVKVVTGIKEGVCLLPL